MKYAKNFVLFWRDFILGDDKRIAISIMWFCLVAYAWTHEFYNIWFMLPVAVLILLTIVIIVDTGRDTMLAAYLDRHTSAVTVLFWPMFLCAVAPLVVFRMTNGDTTSQHFLVPAAITTVIIALTVGVTSHFLARYPSLVSFVCAVVTYLLITYMQPLISHVSVTTAQMYPGVVEFVVVITVTLYGIYKLRSSYLST